MFKRRGGPDIGDIETLIGAGTRIDGDVRVDAGMHIEGRVRGNVAAEPERTATLTIARDGVVEGGVEVSHVIVHGTVAGDIRARDKVELGPTARVSGNVLYGVIEMAAGAVIQGRLVAIPSGAPAAPAASGATTATTGGSGAPAVAASHFDPSTKPV